MYIFGRHAVLALLENHPERVTKLLLQKGDHEDVIAQAKQHAIPFEITDRQELDRLSNHAKHQGFLAMCTKQQSLTEKDLIALINKLSTPAFLVVLDSVQDPHNLGAILRTADAAHVHAVIAPKDKSVGITPTVSKVASGAAEVVPFVQVTNLSRTLQALKDAGIWIYGADAEAKQNLYESDLKGPIALVLGAEGSGLRRLTREQCDFLLHIPMQGSVASLNVSVAAGIFMFEAVRQRFRYGD